MTLYEDDIILTFLVCREWNLSIIWKKISEIIIYVKVNAYRYVRMLKRCETKHLRDGQVCL